MKIKSRFLHFYVGRSYAGVLPAEVHIGLLPRRAAVTTECGHPLLIQPYLVSVSAVWEWFPRLLRRDGKVCGIRWTARFGFGVLGKVSVNFETNDFWSNRSMRRKVMRGWR